MILIICFFISLALLLSPSVSLFLFPKTGFAWMGCSWVNYPCWLSSANAQLTPQLAELACHSLAVLPPRFRAQSKLPFQPRLGSSATAMIQCCCWRFAGLVTSCKAIRNQSLGHPDHQSSPTSLIQTSIVRRSRSLIGGFAPHREKAPCLSFSHLNNVLAPSLYWTTSYLFFLFHFAGIGPIRILFFFFPDK